MGIQNIWACTCGAETPCETEDLKGGSVWRCPRCETIFGCVYPRGGGKVWVTIDPSEADFYDLLARPMDRDEEEVE